MFTSLLRNWIGVTATAMVLAVTATSCHSDGDDDASSFIPQPPYEPETPMQGAPAGPNGFALYGELAEFKYATRTGDWVYTSPVEEYRYSFDAAHRVSCVTSAATGVENPIIYESDKITVRHYGLNDVLEEEFVYALEDGRITSCSRKIGADGQAKDMYRWEYDTEKRVVRAVSLLTGGGIANAYRARWTATGDLAEVVCEEVSDYTAGRDNFGDRWELSYTTTPMTNAIVLQVPLHKPSTSTVLGLKLNPVLLAEGYYGNTAPKYLPASISEYDASKSTTQVWKRTDYRYTLDSEGRVTVAENMYTEGLGATDYRFGASETYVWR